MTRTPKRLGRYEYDMRLSTRLRRMLVFAVLWVLVLAALAIVLHAIGALGVSS